jgi:hypothetical protein
MAIGLSIVIHQHTICFMKECKDLIPGKTYLYTKEILSINIWFPHKHYEWTMETGWRNAAIFLHIPDQADPHSGVN